jgi:hypothetical protein
LIDQLLGVRLMCGTVKKMHKYIFALRLEQHVYSRFLMPLVPKEQVLEFSKYSSHRCPHCLTASSDNLRTIQPLQGNFDSTLCCKEISLVNVKMHTL